jgi:RimJ/RimL family protein N-acetyltransferase
MVILVIAGTFSQGKPMPGNGITIRPLGPEDWEKYREMRLLSLVHDGGVFFGNHDEEAKLPPAAWQADLRDPDDGFLGLFDGDRIIGTVGITTDKGSGFVRQEITEHPLMALRSVFNALRGLGLKKSFACAAESLTGRTAWLGEIFILPEYRGHHLSKPLYQAGVDWALDRPQIRGLMAAVRKSNLASNAAIREHGFAHLYEAPFVWPDGKTDDDIVYRIDLDPLRQALAAKASAAPAPAPS